MATLLILGSKPDPALPPPGAFDALACANASGRSAALHGLPDPDFTVLSTILSSGRKAANDLALEALAGLRTGTVWLYPRPVAGASAWTRARRHAKLWRTKPLYLRWRLHRLGYRWQDCRVPAHSWYDRLIRDLCDRDPAVMAQLDRKQASTGIMALALGLADARFDRYILSGFSFEITHAYADNPTIGLWGTTRSKHAETDIAVLHHLARKFGTIRTTEAAVAERAGVPPLTG